MKPATRIAALVMLGVIGVLACFATSRLVATAQAPRATAQAPVPTTTVTIGPGRATKFKSIEEAIEAELADIDTWVPSEFADANNTVHYLRVMAVPGGIRVKSVASVYDKQPGHRYVWSLGVQKQQKAGVKFRKDYVERAFTPPAGRGPYARMDFDEFIPIEDGPGDYRAKLQLFSLPPGVPAVDGKLPPRYGGSSAARIITIE